MAERINKALARAGVASRRGVESLIREGRVTVDGRRATLGEKLAPGARVKVDGKTVILPGDRQLLRHVIAYHKPEGEICTAFDPAGRRTIFDGIGHYPQGRLISVGRLDLNTSGLLLLTTDGELANRLMHPRYQIERVYRCRALGVLQPRSRERLLNGIELDGFLARFKSIVDDHSSSDAANRWYTVTLAEGRNREVRRMFAAVGLKINRLSRIRYGPIRLNRKLSRGNWEELPPAEVQILAKAVSLDHA